jgi:hypothetical protein
LKADGERIPPASRLSVHRTDDAGNSWTELHTGLPDHEYNAVLRDAAAVDAGDPVGVYFGTRGGSVYASADEGGAFTEVASHLPDVLCVRAAVVVGNPAGVEAPLAAAEATVLAEAEVIVEAAATATGTPEDPAGAPAPA